ncbi:hypothetical protein GCM10010094_26560 [Streptomyces flaveus]|uniref:Uncharacterized protein n=1 Tax=Streptomyces flaveus TaxID=66370 RepID=A0A917QR36_9ACTN|nr:hypothetical protein GCM10010094_26560 [Streptomyces flaveus]
MVSFQLVERGTSGDQMPGDRRSSHRLRQPPIGTVYIWPRRYRVVEVRVGIGAVSGGEGRYGIGAGLVVDVQVGIGTSLAVEAERAVDGIGAGPVADVQVDVGTSLAVEAGRAVDGIEADSAEVTGRG